VHELGITQEIVDVCAARANGAKVVRVVVEIGARSGVMADAVRFAFEVCSKDTSLEGADLEIVERAGSELSVKAMEVEDVRDVRM
jgi:hydrogenase nickel incorporation protein HypA/HybF